MTDLRKLCIIILNVLSHEKLLVYKKPVVFYFASGAEAILCLCGIFVTAQTVRTVAGI